LVPALNRSDLELTHQAGPCFKTIIPPPRLSMKLQGFFPAPLQSFKNIMVLLLKIKF
jgi:hypothetical protein